MLHFTENPEFLKILIQFIGRIVYICALKNMIAIEFSIVLLDMLSYNTFKSIGGHI